MVFKRTMSTLLAGMLALGALPLSLGAAETSSQDASLVEYTDTLTTSCNPGNYITFSAHSNFLSFEGVLTRQGLNQIMFQLQDGNGKLLGNKITFDISSGVHFSAQMSLSDIPDLPDEFFAEVYTSNTPDRSDDLWNNHGKSVLYKKTDGRYRIVTSPVLDKNNEYFDAWINPGASFNADIPDDVQLLADSICEGAQSDYEKVSYIYRWVVENICYDYDYAGGKKHDTATSVADVYTNKYAMPAGFCNILEALLEASDIPAIITYGHTTNMSELFTNTEYKYVNYAVEAFVDGRWIVMLPYRETAKKYENGEYLTWIGRAYRGFDISHEFLATFFKISAREHASESDIPSVWAKEELTASFKAEIVPWKLQGRYTDAITRENFCELIMRMLSRKKGVDSVSELLSVLSVEYSDNFTDTDSEDINGAYILGIVSGRGDGSFDPNGQLSRQEAAVMLSAAAELLGVSASAGGADYSDIESAADWAKESIGFVSGIVTDDGTAVMSGDDAGLFNPLSVYTREQAIITVYRLYTCN